MLDLLVLCHKYVISSLEAYVLSIIRPLTEPSKLPQHLTKELTCLRVLEVADLTGDKRLASAASDYLLQIFWRAAALSDPNDTIPILNHLERTKRFDMIGAAYYYILVSKSSANPWREHLTPLQVQNLEHGRLNLIERWQIIFDEWGMAYKNESAMFWFSGGLQQRPWLQGLWGELASCRFAPYDVVGKVEKAASLWAEYRGGSSHLTKLNNDIKAELTLMFQVDPAIRAQIRLEMQKVD